MNEAMQDTSFILSVGSLGIEGRLEKLTRQKAAGILVQAGYCRDGELYTGVGAISEVEMEAPSQNYSEDK